LAKYTDIKHEDLIMKKAMDIFAEEGLKFFGIDKKVKDSSSTEIVVLEAKNLHMDYTFLMEDDTYIHVEFQTTDKRNDDLRRFRAYEALLSFQTTKDVVTYVVYSNGIHNTKSILQTGINEYNIKVISMYDKDGDIVIKEVEEKLNNNIEVTKQDLVALTFTPIMGGKLTKLDRIIKAIRIVRKINNHYRYDIESMLYAFADKFLDGKDLEKVKEEISMTKLGEMLVQDGIKKGEEKKAIETAKIAIKKGLSDELICELTGLTEAQVSIIRQSISN
jgi:DNA-binding Xre family transcriptional regulator